jgi:hypothetical protein
VHRQADRVLEMLRGDRPVVAGVGEFVIALNDTRTAQLQDLEPAAGRIALAVLSRPEWLEAPSSPVDVARSFV